MSTWAWKNDTVSHDALLYPPTPPKRRTCSKESHIAWQGVEKGRATLSNSMLPSSRDQIHTGQDRTHGTAEVGIIAAGYLLQVVKAEEMPHIVMFFPN